MSEINTPKQTTPPALPIAPRDWSSRFQDQYSNVLRLFFNRLDSTFKNLFSPASGGAALFMPHATFFSAVTQTAGAPDIAQDIVLESAYSDGNLGVHIDSVNNTDITVDTSGVYSCRMALHLNKSNAAAATVTAWVSLNGVAKLYSAQSATFSGQDTKQLGYGFTLELRSTDVVTFHWATTAVTVVLQAEPPASPYPGVASATLGIVYISNELF